MAVTETLLIYGSQTSDGTPHLFAVDKKTGKTVAKAKVEGMPRYGMMTYVHNGHQYVMVQAGPKLLAMALPDAIPKPVATGGGD